MSARTPDPRFLPTREQIAALRAEARKPAPPKPRPYNLSWPLRSSTRGPCEAEGCARPAHARGLCRIHYGELARREKPAPAPLAARCELPAVGARVRWTSDLRWAGRFREWTGIVVAHIPRGASAWALCPADVARDRLLATNTVRAFVRALVEVKEGGRVVYYAPRVERLQEVR